MSPLPSGETPWPPPTLHGVAQDLREWAAWYSGNTDELSEVYAPKVERSTQRNTYSTLANRMRFWGRRGQEAPASRQRLHVPIAADIAATSADLLFGEEPKIRIPEADGDNAPAEAKAAQDRLLELADQLGLTNLLLEGAEVCSAMGGIFLRPGWNLELVPDRPTLDIIHADSAVPEWAGDILLAVTFWKVLERRENVVYRHLERHERGVILHGVYAGNDQTLGSLVPLDTFPETTNLAPAVPLPPGFERRLLVTYVPNVRPNRKHRTLPIGRSDYAGVEDLMDALDETYTSWMRDIRLGQARLIVSEDALRRRGGRGEGATFDYDQEIFTPISMDPMSKGTTGAPIEPVQFTIRTREHAETAANLVERIVTSAGYSPQTFGLQIEGQAESGTALRVREGKTLKTRGRKARFWTPAIEECLEILLAIDTLIIGRTDHGVYRPSVDEAEVIVNNPVEMAQTVNLLRSARVASIETGVRMVQPDLDDAQIATEVQRIQDEDATALDPTGGFA